jgi:hypothetical protein
VTHANRFVSLVVLVLATSAWVALRRQTQRRPGQEPSKAKPAPVQTWEGEGGALPVTGAHMGPDPTVTPPVDATREPELNGIAGRQAGP